MVDADEFSGLGVPRYNAVSRVSRRDVRILELALMVVRDVAIDEGLEVARARYRLSTEVLEHIIAIPPEDICLNLVGTLGFLGIDLSCALIEFPPVVDDVLAEIAKAHSDPSILVRNRNQLVTLFTRLMDGAILPSKGRRSRGKR